MNFADSAILTVVRRELRVEARRAGHYRMRWIAAGVLLAGCAAWLEVSHRNPPSGRQLFLLLGKLTLAGLWLAGPLLTADCLAREKREGTLGLLFLTPLRPRDVVWGKAFLQSWRALVLLVATWPVLAVPLLIGGVGPTDLLRMLLLQAGALGLALAAGVAASAVTRGWWTSRALAVGFTALASVGFVGLHLFLLALWDWGAAWQAGRVVSFARAFSQQVTIWTWSQWMTVQTGVPSGLGSGAASWGAVAEAGGVALGSAGLVWAVGRMAARGLERTWLRAGEARPPGVWNHWLTRSLLSGAALGRWRNTVLAWAPLVWLEQRHWYQRLSLWIGLTLGAVPLVFTLLHDPRADFVRSIGIEAGWIFILGLAALAAGRLQGGGGGGAWEMLVVSPLDRGRLVAGLWGSAWVSLGPGLVLLTLAQGLGAWASFQEGRFIRRWVQDGLEPWPTALAVTGLGVLAALRGRSFAQGWLGTVGLVGVLGYLLRLSVEWHVRRWFPEWAAGGRRAYGYGWMPWSGRAAVELILAGYAWWQAHRWVTSEAGRRGTGSTD